MNPPMCLQPVGDSVQSVGFHSRSSSFPFSCFYVEREVECCMQNQLPQVTPPTAPVLIGLASREVFVLPACTSLPSTTPPSEPEPLIDASRGVIRYCGEMICSRRRRDPIISYLGSIAPLPSELRVILSNQITQVIPPPPPTIDTQMLLSIKPTVVCTSKMQ